MLKFLFFMFVLVRDEDTCSENLDREEKRKDGIFLRGREKELTSRITKVSKHCSTSHGFRVGA